MNIKDELMISTVCYICFQYIYLISVMEGGGSYQTRFGDIIGLAGIQVRNMCTFFATTLLTLRQLKKNEGVEYYVDNRVKMKHNILTLDILMQHTLPFNYFK